MSDYKLLVAIFTRAIVPSHPSHNRPIIRIKAAKIAAQHIAYMLQKAPVQKRYS